MYSEVKPKHPFEVIRVASREVVCDGEGGVLGHPRVFLHIDSQSGEIACPYCSREYVYAPETLG